MNTDIKIIKEFSLPLIRVFGSRACFTRPELKVERVSYEVPTPSALEGLLKAIYWHPGINYRINKIHVLNEIEFESRKCNEITTALNAQTFRKNLEKGLPLPHANCSEHDIRNTAHLINVDYIIEANMVIDELIETKENLIKNLAIFQRRLEKGQYFSKPYLGLREFGAYVEKGNKKDIESGYYYNTDKIQDLGTMLYGIDYVQNEDVADRIKYYHPLMVNGSIDVNNYEVFYYDYPRSH